MSESLPVVGVVGAGIMGRGILQLFVEAGCRVLAHDSRDSAVEQAIAAVRERIAASVAKGKRSAADGEAVCARLGNAPTLTDLAECDIVIEAIVEDLGAKRDLVRRLEEVLPSEAIIASNTSSLSVTAIAAGARGPQRIAGLHFFNPVPLMRVVEVIPGLATASETIARLERLVALTGHRAVRARDTPGFLVNHAGRGFVTEAGRVLSEGIADPATVDAIMRAAGFRMGPFELMDLTGLDISLPVMEQIYRQFYEEPRYRPSALFAPRVAAGLLGRKSGAGWYRYPEGASQSAPVADRADPHPEAAGTDEIKVWIDPRDGARADKLRAHLPVDAIDAAREPGRASAILVAPLGADATATAVERGLDPSRTVAVDTLFGPAPHATLMAPPTASPAIRARVLSVFRSQGAASFVGDSTGFIAPRIVGTIINIACDIAQQRIAAPDDIDAAVTLGLGYPVGPLAWGDRLGPLVVLQALEEINALTGDPRYRPSPWLRRRARLGVSLLHPESTL